MLNFDELEVVNPLGSKAKIHKLGTVYMLNSIVRGYRKVFLYRHVLLLHRKFVS